MPPHTNAPHYQQQQSQQQQQQVPPPQQQGQQQPSQGPQQPQTPQQQGGQQPGNNVGGSRGGGDQQQQAVVAPQQPQLYPSQAIPAGYMVGSPHGYPMQVIPQPPGNVYVSNLTANVNVHGYMPHAVPQAYVAATAAAAGTPPGPGAFITGDIPTGHEMQLMASRADGRGGLRRNGRNGGSSRLGGAPRVRGYIPHQMAPPQPGAVVQQQGPPQQQGQPVVIQAPQPQPQQQQQGGQQQQQQQQSQQQPSQQQQQQQQGQPPQNQPQQPPQQHTPDIVQQHPMAMDSQQMMSQPYAYSGGYFYPLHVYQPVPVGHHPSAQHATGAPIFPVPMYSTMYGYAPGVMYPAMYPPEYQMYDDKADDPQNPQQPSDEPVMHPGLWQPPTMYNPESVEYSPETVEYIPHEDDGTIMPVPVVPPQMQTITHVLDPNVPNFTMGQMGPATIPADEYAPSEEYNTLNNNEMMSPAANNMMSSPSSTTSSQQNLTQNEMYLVPQQPQQLEPQQQQHQQHVQMMELPPDAVLQQQQQHDQQMVDHENNYIIEEQDQPPQTSYIQPMSPPPQEQIPQTIHVQPMPQVQQQQQQQQMLQPEPQLLQQQQQQQLLQPEQPQQESPEMDYIPEQHQQQPQQLMPEPEPEPEHQRVPTPTPAPAPAPILHKPPPPIPIEFLKRDPQLQQNLYNDSNNNPKKKTNEVASVATPATVSSEPPKAAAEVSKPVPNQMYVNSNNSSSSRQQTSAEEVARLTRAVQEKFVLKDDRRAMAYRSTTWQQQQSSTATTISSFTSSTTTVVHHNSSGIPGTQQKKTTASVSVSAIPNKELTMTTATTPTASKPYQKNTSPVPFTTLGTTAAPPSMHHKQPSLVAAPQKTFNSSGGFASSDATPTGPVSAGPMMESKKVEAIPHREPINSAPLMPQPMPPPGPPPLLSVPPPQPPYAPVIVPTAAPPSYAPPPVTTPAPAPPAMSWASLFNTSSSSSSNAAATAAATPAPVPQPTPQAPPPSSSSSHSTPSPFAPSFIPALQRSSNQEAKKPIAKVFPFDKTMSYSAAAAPAAGPQPQQQQQQQQKAGTNKTVPAAQQQQQQQQLQAKMPEQLDENTLKLGEFLSAYQIENNSISILPRGLLNRSNYCYINAILQALVACPPFYHLMRAIRSIPAARNSKHPKPFIDAMTSLVAEFSTLPLRPKVQRDKTKKDETPDINIDSPLEPVVIHKILSLLRSDIFQVEGRQEDAEEFLGCVLNRLNDEMLELMKLSKNESEVNGGAAEETANGEVHGDDQDDWKVIRGNRNKGTVTRTTDFGRSPISDIFGGKLRSRVHREGDHPTDNIQPFFTLQLDIEKAASVRDALDLLVGKDQLEGVTCSKTKQEIQAWQQVSLEELPIVMILHLKCFDYKMDGCTKILKTLEFPIELKIDSKLMSSKGKTYTAKQKQYKLFAVVYHDGKEASKGHYITDVFHAGYGSWIRYDDSTVKAVPEFNVLHPKAPRVPYLLYYRRLDTHYHGANAGSGSGSSTFSNSNNNSAGNGSAASSGGNNANGNFSSSGTGYGLSSGNHYGGSK